MRGDWTKGKIHIDEMGPFDGEYLTEQRWNGWVIPRFDRANAEAIVVEVMKDYEANPIDQDRFFWEGDVLHQVPALAGYGVWTVDGWVQDSEPCEGDIIMISPDEDGMYDIGGCSWCWSAWEEAGS